MTRTIPFYRRDTRWYADIPEVIEAGGSEADNEMILGADTFLDILSNYKDNVALTVCDKEPLVGGEIFTDKLVLSELNGSGADYMDVRTQQQMWLCEVLHVVFGEFPYHIYFKIAA